MAVRYPWDKWFARLRAGRKVILERGKHYWCQPHSMSVQIRAQAGQRGWTVKEHGWCVSVQIDEGTLTISLKK